ncbi:MAG TPA: penicillin-binding transpeptidase domain-containing protein [Pyrinomonadaceae bacterium]|nr:penicillin-binding transpeptidase domain-containing protein [Pyrinomonadaceae bacterium]
MKLMFPENIRVVALLIAITVVFSVSGVVAQSKKQAAKKPAATKKQAVAAKDAKKDKRNKRETAADKRNNKKKEDAKAKTASKTEKKKNSAETKRAEAERRRKEAERRAAALAEQRRREQARREAIARQQAFIRGLRTETVDNIAKDRTDGEDLSVRNVALNALGDQAGSVVVMEAQTGKVLTVVNQEWAVRRTIRPCSTIKLVTAAAGLNEGVIDKQTGAVKNVSTRRMLDDALAFSDNPYFQRVGSNLGNSKLVEYGRKYGLGEPTGINLENESPGRLPVNNSNARIYSHGDDTEVSTIQLAVMASAMTNGGHRVLPRIPRTTEQNERFPTLYKANVELPQQNVRRVIPGMMGAAEYGTARRGMDQTLGVAGKTGSCIDKGTWVGLFTSVAPIEQPKYAVAVILRGPKQRGRYAAAVASKIYSALAPKIVRTDRNLAQTEFNIQPRNTVPTTVATADEDEDEADDAANAGETTGASQPGNVIVIPSAPRAVEEKKLVQKTGSSKPNFPPVVITYSKDGKTSTITSQPDNKKRERVVKP